MAARYVAQRLQMLRVDALRHNANVAMRFDPGDMGRFGDYADGDGDGVLQRDIDDGVDAALASEVHLTDYFAGVSFRVVSDVSSPDGDGIIVAGSDPVRIGKTNQRGWRVDRVANAPQPESGREAAAVWCSTSPGQRAHSALSSIEPRPALLRRHRL
jgi:hypothetical protein